MDLRLRLMRLIYNGRINARKRGLNFDLGLEDLSSMWIGQGGKCSISGIPFIWNQKCAKGEHSPFGPSIDRIDSSRGYTKDNVQMVLWMYNKSKQHYTEADLARVYKNIVVQHIPHDELRALMDEYTRN